MCNEIIKQAPGTRQGLTHDPPIQIVMEQINLLTSCHARRRSVTMPCERPLYGRSRICGRQATEHYEWFDVAGFIG
ncbi:hypothetical protein [Sporomusa sp. KB1]|uniref:hypothetical protein n=1 Tax=Sporomusa sp. KB1 TaxID=943346 RepID=UPI0011A5FF51|nr:hypothetical protein [Sporomusa sp. KB1]